MNPIYPISISLLSLLVITIIGIRKSPRFPQINTVNVLFREQFRSGKSNWLTGSYRNVLEIVVTDQELWIRPFILFFPFAAIFNDIHQVPLTAIQTIETRKRETIIHFLDSRGVETSFSIDFKNPKAFIQTVEQLHKSVKIQST